MRSLARQRNSNSKGVGFKRGVQALSSEREA